MLIPRTKPKSGTLHVFVAGKEFVAATVSPALAAIIKQHKSLPKETKETVIAVDACTIGVVSGKMLSLTGGAAKGGAARHASLSPERRREIAMLANQARWGNKTKTVKKSK